MITVADLRAKFPEVSDTMTYPDAVLQRAIDEAVFIMDTDESPWCDGYDLASGYLSMHIWSVQDATGVGDKGSKIGNITSKSAGGVSVGRASPTAASSLSLGDAEYASTSYGNSFMRIRNSCFMGMYGTC